jgi:nucleoside-diphosphate-sugar epimerase
MDTNLHVIFGAGQVGATLATGLVNLGKRVRVVRKSPAPVAPNVELMTGDATDPRFCAQAARDASVVYHCMNPSDYSAKIWARLVPLYMENLIAAAGSAGARLVVLDNLYMLGRTAGRPMNEQTPMNPCSKKGEIRAAVAHRLFTAHEKGQVVAVSGRASDFYGPLATLSILGDLFWKPAISGSKVRTPADPDAIHTYHYVPDVAAGLAALAEGPIEAYGKAWMLPCQPAESMHRLVDRLSKYFGRNINVVKLPRWLVKSAGFFVPLLREVDEMLYQWDEPFIVDDRAFRTQFGLNPVDREDAAKATVGWAQEHYRLRTKKN